MALVESVVQLNLPATPGPNIKTYDNPGNGKKIQAVAVNDATGAIITPATEATLVSLLENLAAMNSLVPSVFDDIEITRVARKITAVAYKLGADVISTLALIYDGNGDLVRVTKS